MVIHLSQRVMLIGFVRIGVDLSHLNGTVEYGQGAYCFARMSQDLALTKISCPIDPPLNLTEPTNPICAVGIGMLKTPYCSNY